MASLRTPPRAPLTSSPQPYRYDMIDSKRGATLPMNRRLFLQSTAAAGACLTSPDRSQAALSPAKITRVRIYQPPNLNQLFNQSNMLCTIETDAGITGVGE